MLHVIGWFVTLSFFGLFLIFFRDDKELILNDIIKGYNKNIPVAILHTVGLFLMMPFTIAFSLYRIFGK
jgi:hypothetical protein